MKLCVFNTKLWLKKTVLESQLTTFGTASFKSSQLREKCATLLPNNLQLLTEADSGKHKILFSFSYNKTNYLLSTCVLNIFLQSLIYI